MQYKTERKSHTSMKKKSRNGGGIYDRNLTDRRIKNFRRMEMTDLKNDIEMNNSSMKTFRIIGKNSKIDKVDAKKLRTNLKFLRKNGS